MKTPEQKGPINARQESYRTMPHSEKVKEAIENAQLRRSGMMMDKTFEPKTKK